MTIENNKNWKELLPVISELSLLVSALCDFEDSLSIAASKDAQEEINALVTEAQPTLLRFKGLEKKREKLQKELGLAPTSLSALLKEIPEEEREEWAEKIEALEKNLNRFINSKENADRILQVRLSDISLQLEGKPEVTNFRDRRV
ncbi:hypothetical protein HMPREF9624_01668 [Oribacterium asaccharolyticum ACB7]|uniref:FlgN protein n=1 Tax=Oribacterium asaccharolyticum ACB7 TaxID=796944 RepID=G9WRF2_9FIRM|nr:hypothetical protein [Oribacterium asaccharolyticum]EHL14339.1 hypothetical protein HMPREF9624_01668 [Oribacterium asaccharolyticum ACB7]